MAPREQSGSASGGRLRRKQQTRRLLGGRDLERIRAMAREDSTVLAGLVGLLLETDDLIRWRAVEALGVAAEQVARRDGGRVRDLVRRQFWSMNDESGGIAWHAPEAVGEILARVPELADEFTDNLASAGTTSPFEAGVHWALARLAASRPELVQPWADSLRGSLRSEQAAVRGHAARALGVLGDAAAREALEALAGDEAEVVHYDLEVGHLVTATVGELAREACERLKPEA